MSIAKLANVRLKADVIFCFLKDHDTVYYSDSGVTKKYLNNFPKRHTNVVAMLIVLVRLTIWCLDRYCQFL